MLRMSMVISDLVNMQFKEINLIFINNRLIYK